MTIPRILHQIWLGSTPIPDEFQAMQQSWLEYHPGWEVRWWNEHNIPRLVNQEAFDKLSSNVAKADILRYELLLRFGGVYVDTDFECLKNIEPLLRGVSCFIARQRDLTLAAGRFAYYGSAIIGAVPGHPLLRALCDAITCNIASYPEATPPSYLTGSLFLTQIIHEFPDVTKFSPEVFYPYKVFERWRRHEKFLDAYGAHHWSLATRTSSYVKRKTLGSPEVPCITVVLTPTPNADEVRLRWLFEGLCQQSVSNFEVVVDTSFRTLELGPLVHEFNHRLTLRRLDPGSDRDFSEACNVGIAHAAAPRTLFLNSDCLPDTDLIQCHAAYGDRNVILFSYRRIYPKSKLFPFRDTVHYDGIKSNAPSEHRELYIAPTVDQWQNVLPHAFSAATSYARAIGGFCRNVGDPVTTAREFAGRMARAGCVSVPSFLGGRVTQMGG